MQTESIHSYCRDYVALSVAGFALVFNETSLTVDEILSIATGKPRPYQISYCGHCKVYISSSHVDIFSFWHLNN